MERRHVSTRIEQKKWELFTKHTENNEEEEETAEEDGAELQDIDEFGDKDKAQPDQMVGVVGERRPGRLPKDRDDRGGQMHQLAGKGRMREEEERDLRDEGTGGHRHTDLDLDHDLDNGTGELKNNLIRNDHS